ncbi:DNA-directed RNA polymerases I and III subunit RPAC2 isoform X1 [Pelmatolapia mariae]|uniref:DNA-directed RNA polymerases I and III subunit RPAC2 isoform X1 n=1 Tax=Pelmatolapia mariae TaxID=158779 RepID=UPI002FE5CA22
MAGEGEKKAVLEMVQADGADEGCVTFVLHDEDHTLGNSLRYMIMKNADVEFCGYTITHPSESKINFRIQTRGGIPAAEPLRRGLNELSDVCQHVLNTFQGLFPSQESCGEADLVLSFLNWRKQQEANLNFHARNRTEKETLGVLANSNFK